MVCPPGMMALPQHHLHPAHLADHSRLPGFTLSAPNASTPGSCTSEAAAAVGGTFAMLPSKGLSQRDAEEALSQPVDMMVDDAMMEDDDDADYRDGLSMLGTEDSGVGPKGLFGGLGDGRDFDEAMLASPGEPELSQRRFAQGVDTDGFPSSSSSTQPSLLFSHRTPPPAPAPSPAAFPINSLPANSTSTNTAANTAAFSGSLNGSPLSSKYPPSVSSVPASISARRGAALHRLVINRSIPGRISKPNAASTSGSCSTLTCGNTTAETHPSHDPSFPGTSALSRLRTQLQSHASRSTPTPSPSPATSPTRKTWRPNSNGSAFPSPQHGQVPPPSPTAPSSIIPSSPSPLRRSFMFDGTLRTQFGEDTAGARPSSSIGTGDRKPPPSSSPAKPSSSRIEQPADPLLEALAKVWGSPYRRRTGPLHVSRLARHNKPGMSPSSSPGTMDSTDSSSSPVSRNRFRTQSSPIHFSRGGTSSQLLPPLHFQAAEGSVEGVLNELDSSGVALDQSDSKGRTALHLAAAGGHVHVIQAIVDRLQRRAAAASNAAAAGGSASTSSFPPHTHPSSSTSATSLGLHSSSSTAAPATVDWRRVLDAPDSNGSAPLHLAALSGRLDCVLTLLRAGADPTAGDRFGRTPLDLVKARMRLIAGRTVKTTFGVRRLGEEEGIGETGANGAQLDYDPKVARERLILELRQMVDILQFYAARPSEQANAMVYVDEPPTTTTNLTRSSSYATLLQQASTAMDPGGFGAGDPFQARRPPRMRGVSEPAAVTRTSGAAMEGGLGTLAAALPAAAPVSGPAALDLEALTAKLMELSTRQAAAASAKRGKRANGAMEVEGDGGADGGEEPAAVAVAGAEGERFGGGESMSASESPVKVAGRDDEVDDALDGIVDEIQALLNRLTV
ncbi:hypothetical protein HDU96_002138 [Phlyctochytrium bullatum]|nr:hypothetical protein HDU96_002138 [Phlyctochytrium bullatum]